jgi:hypothetical protein
MQHFLEKGSSFSNKHFFISSMQYLYKGKKYIPTFESNMSLSGSSTQYSCKICSIAAPGSVKSFFQNDTIFLFKKMRVPSNA